MSPEKFDFYANAVNVATGIYDVTLHFKSETPAGPPSAPGTPPPLEVSSECFVKMSPQHAKALAILLRKHVVEYEKSFKVTLPVPENISKIADEVR